MRHWELGITSTHERKKERKKERKMKERKKERKKERENYKTRSNDLLSMFHFVLLKTRLNSLTRTTYSISVNNDPKKNSLETFR